ncbi:DnaJ family domain-containing protein [uncultured Jatrophihabitans sp.]|uniref:DnaJ family domain-containing protein n=1 Tax=uncultured Jatrophihabitans sp. TaxID=1610747 RepID=UPI0035CB1560
MTRRRPPNVSIPTWVERQIRDANANGAFDNLEGSGKPLQNLGRSHDDLAWMAAYLKRENVEVDALLPPALALAKEVENLPVRLLRERSEPRARAVVEDLNTRILRALAAPQIGPPLRARPVDVEAVLAQRRADLEALETLEAVAAAEPRTPAAPAAVRTPARRRWRRRRRDDA